MVVGENVVSEPSKDAIKGHSHIVQIRFREFRGVPGFWCWQKFRSEWMIKESNAYVTNN